MTFRPFEEAREFARSLKLAGIEEWRKYCRSGARPIHIPASPHTAYKDQWKGYGDWLRLSSVREYKVKHNIFTSFEEAREFARSLKLASGKEWIEYCKSGKKPKNIPSGPFKAYRNEWKGIDDWLGTGRNSYATKDSGNLLSFEEAREFARSLKLAGQKEWIEYCKSGKKPKTYPLARSRYIRMNGKVMLIG